MPGDYSVRLFISFLINDLADQNIEIGGFLKNKKKKLRKNPDKNKQKFPTTK